MTTTYLWKNENTGEIVESDSYDKPPVDGTSTFRRVFNIGIGRVSGAGEAPSRPSK